jgi:hypothetical protein
VVDDATVGARADEGLDHGHQPPSRQVVDGSRAGLQRRRRRRVVGVDAQQHLAALPACRLDAGGRAAGEPVVDLEHRSGQPAAVHGADDHLALQRTEQQEVLQDVGGTQHAVDARSPERDDQPLQQLPAVGHRQGVRADAQGATGGVVRGDQHQPA